MLNGGFERAGEWSWFGSERRLTWGGRGGSGCDEEKQGLKAISMGISMVVEWVGVA